MNRHYLIYGHGGSFNHGAEALVCTTIALLRQYSPGCRITLSTHFPDQDRKFSIDADEFVERNMEGDTNEQIYAGTLKCIAPDTVCIHIGGDNYCYRNWQRYSMIHYKALEQGAASILWSCSIDPEAIDEEMLKALNTHHLITARECITYDALVRCGLSNVIKVSDIAFTLKPQPVEFDLSNYVALNISPLILRKNAAVKFAIEELICFLLDETNLNIALVPHVLAQTDNDFGILKELFIKAANTKRIILVSDKFSAGQYKSIISGARFGIFARTHATIAAYSSSVPTLALGYSSKAFGIASDLGMSDYVINTEAVLDGQVLKQTFQKLMSNEQQIKKMLTGKMPQYIGNTVNDRVLTFLS
ncbi:polysaccharide pyruvyl transferase family protein [Ruminiclostridium cellobioparum]|uniref:polysaccharide pyruvyl transferase family protein n=1 Tax=Ruminiclostridium cellobioparum TaxID=29355 RepID=UPI00048994B2|nr:polysaccharide pyruvyl transferase family protein [Ruminiclostridium cellobioparum]